MLKAIPVSYETSSGSEFVFGLEPILKLTPRKATALQINFVSAPPDLVVI